LRALEVALELAREISTIRYPKGTAHLRDHLTRAVDNTVLRLSEAGGRTLGNRYQHLEAAYAENQEAQSDLQLLLCRRVGVRRAVVDKAQHLGGFIYGLLRAEVKTRS